ncbi:MAG TPA: nuclear transport factor 2 family protein [Bryobacteraceae bacterium]|nr:nuclear transport factor 2 family protein [Bryobacteraceae bacterium]
MSSTQTEIAQMEERLRLAELGPDPSFFEEALADDAVIVSQDGRAAFAKAQVVEAHRPGKAPKFIRVEVNETQIVDHPGAAVVTSRWTYENDQGRFTLKFMRVWLRKNDRWQVIAASISN